MRNPQTATEQRELPEGKPCVVTQRNLTDGTLKEHRFEHVSVTELSGPGVLLANADANIIAFFPYEGLVSVVNVGADQPKGRITQVTLAGVQ